MVVCIWRNKKNANRGGLPYEAYQKDSDSLELEEHPNQANQLEPQYMEPVEYANPLFKGTRIDQNLFSSDNFNTTIEDDMTDKKSSPGNEKHKWLNTAIANKATQPEPEYQEPVECTKPLIKNKKCKCCKCFDSSGTIMEHVTSDEASSPESGKPKWSDKTKAKSNPYVLG